MKKCIVLLLLAAVVAVPSLAFADVQTINFRCIFQYCHNRFYALAGVTMYDPTTADWTVEGGVGILDANEMEILQLILANTSAPHHAEVHAAFAQNAAAARTAIGSTIIGLTTSPATTGDTARQLIPGSSPAAYYAADGLMGAYLTMGEWMLYDTTMAGFKDSPFGSAVQWTINTGEHEAARVNYDLSQGPYVNMCGDLDNDGAKNCNEYWAAAPNSYANALNPAVTTAAMIWSSWTCLDENNGSYRFIYNPDTERVYMTSPAEITWDEALAFNVQYPGGATLPTSMVTIRNQTENDYAKALGNGNTVWIGCTDEAKDGPAHTVPNDADWYWLSDPTQSVMTYHNWNHPPHGTGGEPNGINHAEDCGTMRDDGTWNDVNKWDLGDPGTEDDQLRTYYAIYETTGTWPDADENGAPDAFEDKNGDLIPDEFGVPLPSADFEADVTEGDMPLTVQFTDLSEPNGEDITSWAWDFGDGETSDLPNPEHTYMAADPSSTYSVSLTVTNANGTDTTTKANYITVNYVCEFEGQLSFQGMMLNEAIMAEVSISDDLKALLTALGMTTWIEWDIEGIEADFPPNPPTTIPGDGLLDAAQIALIEAVACNTALDANAVTYAGMATNKALFLEDVATLAAVEPDFAALALFSDLFAGMIGSSTEMKDTINALIYALTSGYTGLPQYAEYVVFGVGKEGPLFGADGDLDGDGLTNLTEWNQIVAAGGGIDTFVDAATDPDNFWTGNPDLPVTGILGLGLLAGAVLMSAARALRKK